MPRDQTLNPKFLNDSRYLLLISLICLLIGSIGITWGLPSVERNKLYFSDGRVPNDIPQHINKPFKDYPEFPWERAHDVDKKKPLHDEYNLAVFNPIRSYHPDEYVIFKALASTNPARLDFDTEFYGWPSFFIYVVGAALEITSLLGLVKLTPDIQFYFRNPNEMAKMYIVGRSVVLLFSAVSACFLYSAAKNFYDRRVAIFSSLLLCVLPIFVINQHYMTADIPMVAFACVGLFFVSKILTSAKPKWYILAGISLGLAFGMKYQGALLIASVPLAHFLKFDFLMRHRIVRWNRHVHQTEDAEPRDAPRAESPGIWWVIIACAASLIAFCIVNPYHIFNFSKAFNIFGSEVGVVSFNASNFSIGNVLSTVIKPLQILVHGFGVFSLLFIIFGIACSLWWRERADILLLSQFILVYAAMGMIGTVFIRHYIPLLPIAVLLCARAIFGIADKICQNGIRRCFLGISCLLVFIPALIVSGAFVNICRQENVRTTAGKWIVKNIPSGSEIGMAEVPWQYEMPPFDLKRYKVILTGHNIENFQSSDWFITSSAQTYWAFRYPTLFPKEYEFWNYVINKNLSSKLVARFERPAFPLNFIDRYLPEWLRWVKLENAPEDMTYLNPTILVFRKAVQTDH